MVKQSKYSIETRIMVSASIDKVWSALLDLPNYDKWNKFIPSATGETSVGSTLNIFIHVPGTKRQKYRVKILNIVEKRNLQWLGHFWIPGLIDGVHSFELQQIEQNKTLLIQKETFRGFLVPFVWKSFLNTKLRSGFELLNQELKSYLENKEEIKYELSDGSQKSTF